MSTTGMSTFPDNPIINKNDPSSPYYEEAEEETDNTEHADNEWSWDND